jgi:hypothetical protein
MCRKGFFDVMTALQDWFGTVEFMDDEKLEGGKTRPSADRDQAP